MKLKALRLANAIKAGSRQLDFLDSQAFEMEFVDAVRIKVTPKTKPELCVETSIFNAIWWQPLTEASPKKGVK